MLGRPAGDRRDGYHKARSLAFGVAERRVEAKAFTFKSPAAQGKMSEIAMFRQFGTIAYRESLLCTAPLRVSHQRRVNRLEQVGSREWLFQQADPPE